MFVLLFTPARLLGADHDRSLENCNWGFKKSEAVLKLASRDPLAPQGLSGRQLCHQALSDEKVMEDGWIRSVVSSLEIQQGHIKPEEFATAQGNCRLGSVIYQKLHGAQDNTKISLIGDGICRNLPSNEK